METESESKEKDRKDPKQVVKETFSGSKGWVVTVNGDEVLRT